MRTRRAGLSVAVLMLWIGLLLAAAPALALSEDEGYRPEPNSIVHTLTSTSYGTLVGGNFTFISGAAGGKWAMLDAAGEATPYSQVGFSSGVVLTGLETTNSNGVAETVIAGSFAGHIRRFNVLGEPAIPWSAPNPDGTIRALAEAPATSGAPGIYIAGEFSTVNGQTRRRVALLNANGQHSTSFIPPNFTGTAHALAVQDDGKVLVGGSLGIVLTPQRLYRLNPDGSLDASFQPVSMSSGNRTVYAIEVEDDGRILVAGSVDGNGFIVRLNSDGSLASDYEPPSLNGPVYALDLLPDGRALIGGDFTSGVGLRSRIARLNENGSVDNSFAFFINPNGPVRAVLVQDDGSVLIGGGFNQIGNLGRSHLARLDARGVVDQPLVAQFDNRVTSIVVEADGRLLVAGSFDEANGVQRRRMVRLNPNGSVSSSWQQQIAPGIYPQVLAVLRNGQVLMASESKLRRLNPDGTRDTAFPEPEFLIGSVGGEIRAMLVQDDGRILVGGKFTQVAGQPRRHLVRLLPNGAVDSSFSPSWTEASAPHDGVNALLQGENDWIYTCNGEDLSTDERRLVSRFSSSGVLSTSFSPGFQSGGSLGLGRIWRGLRCQTIAFSGVNLVVAGDFRSTRSGRQDYWSVIDQDGNHTVDSFFIARNNELSTPSQLLQRGSGYLLTGRTMRVFDASNSFSALVVNPTATAVQSSVQPWTDPAAFWYGGPQMATQLTPDGRSLLGVPVNGQIELVRLSNPDGLPLRQRIVWGTSGNPDRLVWDRITGFGSAPAVLGTPRVLVSQICCDADNFAPAAGGGWMSRDGDDWRLEGFAGLPGKFYVRIEYRAGNSKNSYTLLTPIQRLYGEVPPAVDTADLSLKLVIDQDPVEPGDVVIVDVLAANRGPDLAGLPSVSINLPAGYTLLAFDDSDQGTFLPDELLWKLDDLAGSGPAADARLRLQLQLTQQTPYAIEAEIFAAEFDPNLNNNVATLIPDVQRRRSDLKLLHSVTPEAALPDDRVTFALLLDNLGPEQADAVEVAHLLPTGYSYQGHNSSQGSYNSASGQWQLGGLDVGEGALLEVEAVVNSAGGFASSASASSYSEDPEPFNNLAFAEIDPFTDLSVSIAADAEWAGMGDPLTMTVQMVNNGPREADATSVQVQTLSGGFIPAAHFASIGEYEPNSGLWTLGQLAPGESATLVIEGSPGFPEDTEVGATVSSAAFELAPADNSASVRVRYQFPGPWGQVSPASIDFGEVMVGQSSNSVVITVTSVGDQPLQMGFTNTDGEHQDDFVFDGGTCRPSDPPLDVGETCIVSLRFVPQAQGLRTAEVVINANDPNAPFTIPVSGSGQADNPDDVIFTNGFEGMR